MKSEPFENARANAGELPAPVPERIILAGLCGAVFVSPVSISISTMIQPHSALLLAVFAGLGGTAAYGVEFDGKMDGAAPGAPDKASRSPA